MANTDMFSSHKKTFGDALVQPLISTHVVGHPRYPRMNMQMHESCIACVCARNEFDSVSLCTGLAFRQQYHA
jgi:hypothetical protein